jgi:hypothetical protein
MNTHTDPTTRRCHRCNVLVTYADAPIRRFGRTYCRPCYEAIRFSAVTDTTGLVAL